MANQESENKEFYVKYGDNVAVPIDTSYGKGPKKDQPLVTVGHLIAVCRNEEKGQIGLPEKFGPLTLHLPVCVDRTASGLLEDCFASNDSADTALDPGCKLSLLGLLGTKSKEPLILKSRNEEQGIDVVMVGNEMPNSSSFKIPQIPDIAEVMKKVLDERDIKKSTCAISSVTSQKWYSVRNRLRLTEAYIEYEEPIPNVNIPPYQWIDNVAEDNDLQRTGYMEYLQRHLGAKIEERFPKKFHILDVATNKSLLTVLTPELPFQLSGGTDVVIVDNTSITYEENIAGLRFYYRA